MPTIVHSFADIEVQMRLDQIRATEGLNQQQAVALAHGIYRGFILGTHGSDLTVTVSPDPEALDSVAIGLTSDSFTLTVRKIGSFAIDLTAFASTTVYLALVPFYSIAAPTTFQVQVYSQAEFDALSASDRVRVVFMGRVVVPAAGVIPTANITHTSRVSAFTRQAKEGRAWVPILANASFELADPSATYARAFYNWVSEVTAGAFAWTVDDAQVDAHGGTKSVLVDVTGAGPFSGTLVQPLLQPLRTPGSIPGQRVRVTAWVREDQAATAGALELRLRVRLDDGTFGGMITITDPVDTGAGVYRQIDRTIEIPDFGPSSVLDSFEIALNALDGYGVGAALHIDDVQVWLEPEAEGETPPYPVTAVPTIKELRFETQGEFANGGGNPILRARTNGTNSVVRFERQDQTGAGPDVEHAGDVLNEGAVTNQGVVTNEDTTALKKTATLGGSLLTTNANAEIPRTAGELVDTAAAPRTYTLIQEYAKEGVPLPKIRLYLTVDDGASRRLGFALTTNARRNNTTELWERDTATVHAFKTEWSLSSDSAYGLDVKSTDATATASWAEAAWDFQHFMHQASDLSNVLSLGSAATVPAIVQTLRTLIAEDAVSQLDYPWTTASVLATGRRVLELQSSLFQTGQGTDDGDGWPLRLAALDDDASAARNGYFFESFHQAVLTADNSPIVQAPLGPTLASDDWTATIIADFWAQSTYSGGGRFHAYTQRRYNVGSWSGNVSGDLFFGTGGSAGTEVVAVEEVGSRIGAPASMSWPVNFVMSGPGVSSLIIRGDRIVDNVTPVTTDVYARLRYFFNRLTS